MIPLVFANIGDSNIIKRISGNAETKRHLENLGFVPGGEVSVVSKICGNIIVNVKESRVALGEDMARRILI